RVTVRPPGPARPSLPGSAGRAARAARAAGSPPGRVRTASPPRLAEAKPTAAWPPAAPVPAGPGRAAQMLAAQVVAAQVLATPPGARVDEQPASPGGPGWWRAQGRDHQCDHRAVRHTRPGARGQAGAGPPGAG